MAIALASNKTLWGRTTYDFLISGGSENKFSTPQEWWEWRRDFYEKDWEKWEPNKTKLRITAISSRSSKFLGSTGFFKGIPKSLHPVSNKKLTKVTIGVIDAKTKEIKDLVLDLWQVQKA